MEDFKGYVNGTDNSSVGWHLVGDNLKSEIVNFKGTETVLNKDQSHKVLEETTR